VPLALPFAIITRFAGSRTLLWHDRRHFSPALVALTAFAHKGKFLSVLLLFLLLNQIDARGATPVDGSNQVDLHPQLSITSTTGVF
jgi:hypothetical protein